MTDESRIGSGTPPAGRDSFARITLEPARRCPGALKAARLKGRMLLQVHDELLFEVPDKEIDKTKDVTCKVMEGAATLSVPLVVDTGVGDNWAAAH